MTPTESQTTTEASAADRCQHGTRFPHRCRECEDDEFSCCGGNDETPKDHCMDCPARSEEELRQAAINAGEAL